MSETEVADSDKGEKKESLKDLALKLGVVQRKAKDLSIPALVIIEGLDASEKGLLLNQMLLEIDSRAYRVLSTHSSDRENREYPLLQKYWYCTPEKGRIQFFDRSAYYLVLESWAEGAVRDKELSRYWRDISRFEKQLSDDGVQIVKVFLTISRKEQAKRLEELEQNPKTARRVKSKDWKRNRQYKDYLEIAENMIEATNHDFAAWNVIDTKDTKKAAVDLYEVVIAKLEAAIETKQNEDNSSSDSKIWIPYDRKNYLAKTKTPEPMDRAKYKATLKERQAVLHDLVQEIYYHRIPVVMVFCGWDAAGKGGCIKRILQGMDPRGYDVIPVGAPTRQELNHHYLWRFWKEIPRRGHFAIFDRSWYGRVLVERVEGLCTNEEWQRAYREINEMEEHLLDFGTSIIKFWLNIHPDTQLERFEARQNNPHKQWKITDEDWRNRKKWSRYEEAVNEMVEKTNTSRAPWQIVDSNCKMRARIQTIDTTIDNLETALKKRKKKKSVL